MPLETIATIGGALGGMGQFGSGLADMMGDDDLDIKKATKHGMKYRLKYARKYGEKYGFHPLAALGINPAMGPIGRASGGNRGDAMYKMGQGIKKIGEAGQSEIQKAQARLLNLKGDLVEQQIAKDSPEGQGIIETELAPPPDKAYEAGVKPMEMIVGRMTQTGELILDFFPSRDTQDYLSESFIDNWKYRIQKEWKGYADSVRAGTRRGIEGLRDRLDHITMTHPPDAGHYYALSLGAGRPIQIRNNKYNTKKLVDSKHYPIPRYTGFQHWKNTK